jgi:hypothetical protein
LLRTVTSTRKVKVRKSERGHTWVGFRLAHKY